MNILTDQEVLAVKSRFNGTLDVQFGAFARAIEAAVLEKVGKVDVEPDANKRKAERLVRMLTDGYSGMKAAREVIALLEQWPDSPASALAALRAKLEAAQADLALREAEVSSLQIDKEQAQADAARMREALEKCKEALVWEYGGEPLGTLTKEAIDAARAALGEKK